MKDKIKEALIAATDEIFFEWETKLHVVSGDNSPMMVYRFDELIDQLAEQMELILQEQPKLGIAKLEMLDGTEINLAKTELGCDMVLKLAEVEKYLREREVIQ